VKIFSCNIRKKFLMLVRLAVLSTSYVLIFLMLVRLAVLRCLDFISGEPLSPPMDDWLLPLNFCLCII
jgi:hypothetical protein